MANLPIEVDVPGEVDVESLAEQTNIRNRFDPNTIGPNAPRPAPPSGSFAGWPVPGSVPPSRKGQ